MSTLRNALQRVKENAVTASAENLTAERALADLCQHGEHTRDGVTYTLTVSGPYDRQSYDGHRFAATVEGGHSYHRTTILGSVLSWLVRPIEQIVVEDSRIVEKDGLYAHADCPFGCGRAERTAEITTRDEQHYRRINARYHWHGCDHFVGEVSAARVAVFAAGRDDVRRCWSCGSWTDEQVDACASCDASKSADPSIDAENRGDARRES